VRWFLGCVLSAWGSQLTDEAANCNWSGIDWSYVRCQLSTRVTQCGRTETRRKINKQILVTEGARKMQYVKIHFLSCNFQSPDISRLAFSVNPLPTALTKRVMLSVVSVRLFQLFCTLLYNSFVPTATWADFCRLMDRNHNSPGIENRKLAISHDNAVNGSLERINCPPCWIFRNWN